MTDQPITSLADFPLSEADATPAELAVVIDPIARRRTDIDAKQARVAAILADMQCEGVILFVPAHVAWFTGGINVRGLIADTERPGVYTNGKQRWLICSNVDTQRLFDEELDGLGFQLKEWQWGTGRAVLLGEIAAGKPTASDKPFPNMPLINDRLRTELRPLAPFDRDRYLDLGRVVAHAIEATARTLAPGDPEAEVAGQVAHRLHRHGADVAGVSVTADARGRKFRRAGFTDTPVAGGCVLQATGTRDGLYVTAARTVWFGPPNDAFKAEHDAACRLSVGYRSWSVPDQTVGAAAEAGRRLLADGPFEYEWRHSQPGYGAGWYPAEELRRMGQDEKFVADQALVWQARVGAAAVVDTVLVSADGAVPVTPPAGWPFKRVKVKDRAFAVPDVLVRS
jgi:hypothetical protein